MSSHEDWITQATQAVEAEFPSLSYIDARRVVRLAVQVYDQARWDEVMKKESEESL